MLIGDDSANEEPRLSSAASLLRLHHLGATFGPTYTHQCFDDERVRGFQPYGDAIRETERRYATSPLALMNDVGGGAAGAGGAGRLAVSRQASRGLRESLIRSHDLPHKSFQHHETATHRLSLEVVLAPSCRSCAVIVRTEAKKRDRAGSTASEASLVSSSSSSVPSSRSVSPYFDLQVQPTNDGTAGGGAGGTGGGGKRRRVGRSDSDCENNDRKSPPLAVGAAASMSVLEQLDGIVDGNGIGTNANNTSTATAISSTGPKIVFSSKSTTGIPLAAVAPGATTMIVRPLSSYAAASSSTGGGGRAGRTRRRRMEIDEVLDRISRALPPVVRCDHIRTDELGGGDALGGGSGTGLQQPMVQVGGATIDEVRGDYLSHPLGTVLREYQRPIRNANATLMTSADSNDTESMGDFVLCLADGRDEGVAAYHNRVQRLALWYIENGSEVDLASTDSGGYWKVLYVFRRHAIANAGDDDDGDDAKMPSVAGEAKDGKDGDDVKPAASSSGDQTSQTSSHQSSPLVKRAVSSFYSTCDSLVSLFSGRHSHSNTFEERVNAEPLDLPLPSSQSLEGSIDDDNDDDKDSSSNKVKYEYSLVGFMTLFHCYSQYKKPSAGTICRMCQAVVLPSFQRAGHGKMMMVGAHEVAKGRYADMIPLSVGQRGDIVEVDVEDPAIEFTALRDRVDYEMVRDAIASDPRSVLGVNVTGVAVSQEDYYLPLSGPELVEASSILKITPDQVQIALELYKRNALDDEILRQMREKKKKPATKRQAVAKLEGMYESMVKKRLTKVFRDDISGCGGGKAEKDAVLDYLYDETMAHYRSILGKRKRSARTGGQDFSEMKK